METLDMLYRNYWVFRTMSSGTVIILFLLCQFVSSQSCPACGCCYEDGASACDADQKCKNGCIEGYYGDKCVDSCPENCRTCTDNITCTECHPGYNGPHCAFKCGRGCVNNTCLQSGKCNCTSDRFVDGWCLGCSLGFHGDDCDESCPQNCGSCMSNTHCTWCKNHRYYESYCQFSCSEGCDSGKCIKADGTCECKPSFTGAKCDSCVSGKHGPNCDLDCPGNCTVCLSNSNCTQCKPGYYGSTCTNICPSGCNESKCDIDGMCTNGCKPRFNSRLNCEICERGMWGDLCQYKCPDKCSSCTSNQNCTNCINGYYGTECKEECPSNCLDTLCKHDGRCYSCKEHHFGYFCQSNCSPLCFDRNCSMADGQCLHCIENYFGKYCELECEAACRGASGRTKCNETDGLCFLGCLDGYYGNRCERKCSDKCLNLTCERTTGACVDGCIEGYEGFQCLQTMNQNQQEGHTSGEMLGATFGAGLIGILFGVMFMFAFVKWRKRRKRTENNSNELTGNGTENISAQQYGDIDSADENVIPATYEELKGRDERTYSQLNSNQQLSPQSADYINC